jgi:hypothetical protein
MGELVSDKNMWAGGAVGLAAAVAVSWVLGNLLWIGVGVAVLAAAGVTWGVLRIIREHRSAPQSSMWTPDKARTVSRAAVEAPARAALPAPQRALPAGKPALTEGQLRGLADLAGPIIAVQAAARKRAAR